MFCDDFVTSYISLSAFLVYSQFVTPFYLHLRWKMLAIHERQEAQGKADCEDLAESPPSFFDTASLTRWRTAFRLLPCRRWRKRRRKPRVSECQKSLLLVGRAGAAYLKSPRPLRFHSIKYQSPSKWEQFHHGSAPISLIWSHVLMDISSLFEEMIDLISFFLYKRKKAASSHHNFASRIRKYGWEV